MTERWYPAWIEAPWERCLSFSYIQIGWLDTSLTSTCSSCGEVSEVRMVACLGQFCAPHIAQDVQEFKATCIAWAGGSFL